MSQGAGENGMGSKGGGMQMPQSPYSYTANRPLATTVGGYYGAANLPRLGDVRMQSDLGQQSRDFVAQFANSRSPMGAYVPPPVQQTVRPTPYTGPANLPGPKGASLPTEFKMAETAPEDLAKLVSRTPSSYKF